MNPRNHKWRPLAVSLTEELSDGTFIPGNFRVDWRQAVVEVHDRDNHSLGLCPVLVYGEGLYRPHSPGHFLEDSHVNDGNSVWVPTVRAHNPALAMDEDAS
jgi:hypothetical protein